jgi:hypothetical protein
MKQSGLTWLKESIVPKMAVNNTVLHLNSPQPDRTRLASRYGRSVLAVLLSRLHFQSCAH